MAAASKDAHHDFRICFVFRRSVKVFTLGSGSPVKTHHVKFLSVSSIARLVLVVGQGIGQAKAGHVGGTLPRSTPTGQTQTSSCPDIHKDAYTDPGQARSPRQGEAKPRDSKHCPAALHRPPQAKAKAKTREPWVKAKAAAARKSQAKAPPCFDAIKAIPFEQDNDKPKIIVVGKPLPVKQTGGHARQNTRFNIQKKLQEQYVNTVSKAQALHKFSPKSFGKSNIKVWAHFGPSPMMWIILQSFYLIVFDYQMKMVFHFVTMIGKLQSSQSKRCIIKCCQGLTAFEITKTKEKSSNIAEDKVADLTVEDTDDDDETVDMFL
eukprot:jgi/Psemu1/4185/gm1.4185_g